MGNGCIQTVRVHETVVNATPLGAPLAGEAASKFKGLLGERLLGKGGEIETEVGLGGASAVAIFFSAHWCPACRGFTPEFANAYMKSLRSKGLRVVFASSDNSETDFNSSYHDMPWLALPYGSDLKDKLLRKFKVRGVPTVIILDADGNLITTNGRTKISSDPHGKDFPWEPKPFAEVIGEAFCKGDVTVGKEAIQGKTLGIYFSAHWCPPCRGFTPKLAEHYNAYKKNELNFEIIFCTSDRDEAAFRNYSREMMEAGGDWLALPWAESTRRAQLEEMFEVSSIPCLVIIDEHGRIINNNARSAIANDPTGASFPWAPPLVADMAHLPTCDFEHTPSLIVFMDKTSEWERNIVRNELQKVAEKYADVAKAKERGPSYLFFTAAKCDGPVPAIRDACELPDVPDPVMVLLDIAEHGPRVEGLKTLEAPRSKAPAWRRGIQSLPLQFGRAFYMSESVEKLSEASIGAFLRSFEDKVLPRRQFKLPQ